MILRLRNDIVKGGQGNVDLAKYYGYTTLDVMGELALGDSFQGLDGDGEHAWVQDFFLGVKFGSIRSSLSRFYPLDLIFGYVFLGLTSRIRQRNVKIGTDMITRRLGFGDLGPGKSDFISPVIGNVNEEQKKGITRAELNVNVIAMLLAGCQLTTVALAAATYFLLRYPETITALNQEIRTRFESENDIHVASMQELPYLEAVIMEALRMHHPTPSDPKPRVIASGGQRVDGYWIPGGVSSSIPQVHSKISSFASLADHVLTDRHRSPGTSNISFAQQLRRPQYFSSRALVAEGSSSIRFSVCGRRQGCFPTLFDRT